MKKFYLPPWIRGFLYGVVLGGWLGLLLARRFAAEYPGFALSGALLLMLAVQAVILTVARGPGIQPGREPKWVLKASCYPRTAASMKWSGVALCVLGLGSVLLLGFASFHYLWLCSGWPFPVALAVTILGMLLAATGSVLERTAKQRDQEAADS